MLTQQLRAKRIGDVERKIADLTQTTTLVVVERREVAHENSCHAAAFDEFEVALFPGFDDARGCGEDFGAKRCRFFVATRVFEVAVDFLHATGESGFELLDAATQHGEHGLGTRRLALVLWQ